MESESGQLFNFYGGDFDTQWRVIATAAKGVGGSFQPAITVDWTTWRSDLSGWPLIQNNYRTVITPRIAWQIWNKVRVTAQLESKIHHTVKKGRFTGTTLHEYTSEWWSLDLFFDLIL
jgi:hypothetical protein